MNTAFVPHRLQSVATLLGLVTASILCLCAGAMLAVSREGLPRLLFAVAGFFCYLFFFSRALHELALPSVLVEGRPTPDGEVQKVQREPDFQRASDTADGNHVLPAAA